MSDQPKPPVNQIAVIDPAIAEWHDEWTTNRAMVAGARAVRAGGEKYLPKFASVSSAQHEAIIERTPFFAGASLTHKGLMGLLFRKPPKLTVPAGQEDVLNTITIEGDSVLDLAEDVADELLVVNFSVLLTDYPSAQAKNLKEAIDLGIRPNILLYAAESIIGIETGVVNNRKRVTRVRLQEDANTVRELRLDNSVYTVNTWRKSEGGDYAITETYSPTRQKKGGAKETLNEIPVTIVTTGRKAKPHTAPLYDVCDLNKSHFHVSSNLATCDYWMTNPIPWVTGSMPKADISLEPGTVWQFEEADAKTGMLEYSGAQAEQLESRTATLRDYMASAGARILASEKAAPESAHALEIRNAAETATLDGIARVVERAMNDQLGWVAWWLGLDDDAISLTMSTDFVSAKLTPDERKQIVAEWQAGLYSQETVIGLLTAGNSLPEDFDLEKDRTILSQEVADRPSVIVTPDTGQDDQPTI